MSIKVLIADDHPVVRMGIRALLESADSLTIVAECKTGEEAVDYCAKNTVDVALLDLQFGTGITGAQACQQIIAQEQDVAVLILTNYDTDSEILAAVEAGAKGYLLKDTETDELVAAVEAAARGESALSPTVMNAVVRSMQTKQVKLSKREKEVVKYVAQGLSNKEISQKMFVSEATIKSHLVNIFDKLDVQSRTQVIVKAQELGLL
ncbi:MAG: response regulator transcription factor [Micrococcaceae bacterium]